MRIETQGVDGKEDLIRLAFEHIHRCEANRISGPPESDRERPVESSVYAHSLFFIRTTEHSWVLQQEQHFRCAAKY